jgi:dipeptidyl aminopeptidase/acylaminoacyl peptidase
MKIFTNYCLKVTSFLILLSLNSFAQTVPLKPKPVSWADVANWKSIPGSQVQISQDGVWMAYIYAPNEGDADLIVQKTADTTKYVYPVGSVSFASYTFSEDGKWLAFKVYPKDKEAKQAKKTNKTLYEKLVLVELAKNKKTEFEKVKSYSFSGEKSDFIAIQLVQPETISKEKDAPKGSDLLLYELASGKTLNIGNVSEMAFNKKGDWLALAIDANGQVGNGVELRNMTTGVLLPIENDKAVYKSLSWTEKGDALVFLKGIKDEKYKSELYQLVGLKNFIKPSPDKYVFNPKEDKSFPAQFTISPNRRPEWTEDLSAIAFGICKAELNPDRKESKPSGKDTSKTKVAEAKNLEKKEDVEKPDMVIWHYQDKRLQSAQQVQETRDKNFSYLSIYHITDKKFIRLADSTLRNISVGPKQLYGIGIDNTEYELDGNLDGKSYADFYVIDLKTGSRTKVLEKLYQTFYASPQPSPNGKSFLYYKEGHYFVYDIVTKTDKNITQNAKTAFVDKEDDHNVKFTPTPVIGWSNDSKFVLLSDGWDIWKISADGKTSVNLTQNGKVKGIRYQNRYVIDFEEKGIDLKQSMFFRTLEEKTKKGGIVKIDNGLPGAKQLLLDDAAFGRLLKAKKASTYLYTKESFKDAPDFYATARPDLNNGKKVTNIYPEQKNFAWSSGVRLVNYISDKGDTLQGALFLPAGYEEGKKYPTIVYIYEKLSQGLNAYTLPAYPGGGFNKAVYTSQGYAVFMPDIVYKLNDPGMSAVWCVVPAVKAAIQTGIVDEKNVAIHGHSWGGYQTSFLITQTNIFKSAAAGAPLTNMISMYSLIYWNTGGGNMAIFESSQGRLTTGYWDNWEAYTRNSPVYHVKNVKTPLLLLHNDKDGAVDFTQGVEYYNALRRLKKPVVMIQYKGENHGIAKLPNRKDYAVRMLEFFDHHLKGKLAPEWLEKGIPKLDMETHLDKRTETMEGEE